MDIRRVQLTGGSSYIITLPKEWINSYHIKKNDPLGIHIQSDGTLLLTPKMTQEQLQKTKEFDIRQISKPTYLLQQLIGAYIAGYTSIKITSPTKIPMIIQNIIRSFTQLAIGPEVIEETEKSVVLKDLLNPTEMPFDQTLKRMYVIVKRMHEDVMRAMHDKDKNLAADAVSRDNDVDRLHWFVARQYNILLQNASLVNKMNITIETASTCFLISRIIERIGDHIVRISENIPNLIDHNLDKKSITKILAVGNLSLEIFNRSISSFFKKDIHASNENIESVKSLESFCEEINTRILQQEGIIALSVGYIVESTRRIGEYSEDISETVINYLVGTEQN